MASTWDYLKDNALETEASYPFSNKSYTYGLAPACTANTALGIVKTQPGDKEDYTKVNSDNTDIQSAIDQQPIAANVYADSTYFQ